MGPFKKMFDFSHKYAFDIMLHEKKQGSKLHIEHDF